MDESVPVSLRLSLSPFEVETVAFNGWRSVSDLEILDRALARFEVFVTADKNIPFQINPARYDIAILVLPTNNLLDLLALAPDLIAHILLSTPGAVRTILP